MRDAWRKEAQARLASSSFAAMMRINSFVKVKCSSRSKTTQHPLTTAVCAVRFGLEKGELKDVDELLEEVTRKVHHIRPQSRSPTIPLVSLLGMYAETC